MVCSFDMVLMLVRIFNCNSLGYYILITELPKHGRWYSYLQMCQLRLYCQMVDLSTWVIWLIKLATILCMEMKILDTLNPGAWSSGREAFILLVWAFGWMNEYRAALAIEAATTLMLQHEFKLNIFLCFVYLSIRKILPPYQNIM